jgi:hypothetical protein
MFIELKDAAGRKEIINLNQVKRFIPIKEGYTRMFFEDSMDKFVVDIVDNKNSEKPGKVITKGPKAYYGYKDYTLDYSVILKFLESNKTLIAKLRDEE